MPHRRHLPPGIGAALGRLFWPLLAGIALGGLAMIWLRLRGLRWPWALLDAPPAVLAWLIEWRAGLAIGIATVLAVYGGARSHHEAIKRGGEEARRRHDEIGPFGFLRAHLSGRRTRRLRLHRGTFALGRTRRGTRLCGVGHTRERREELQMGSVKAG